MSKTGVKNSPKQIYGEANLIYIRYNATIEEKGNGQKKIKGDYPQFTKIERQPEYKKGDGAYYSLLMGREVKPGRFVILLDFDNKEDEDSHNGLTLAKLLKMKQYKAPEQSTPSGGLHYLFTVSAEEAGQINSRTGITYKNIKYNMDVKFKNSLCNCSPSKIEGYGEYVWKTKLSRLQDIPELPKELFDLIKKRTATTTSIKRTAVAKPTSSIEEERNQQRSNWMI
jgi:hypothetical protein